MKNFIIFFDEKEGTTAIVNLLDQLEGISVVKSSAELNWEPFDMPSCGPLSLPRVFRLLNLLFRSYGPKRERLLALYKKSTRSSLKIDMASTSVGLKMRLQPHKRPTNHLMERFHSSGFRRLMYLFLRLRGVTVFVAVHKYGIDVHPLYYEEFLTDPKSFLNNFRLNLGLPKNNTDNEAALSKESVFRKVHSDDISEFVVNHEEVKNRFCESWVPWISPL